MNSPLSTATSDALPKTSSPAVPANDHSAPLDAPSHTCFKVSRPLRVLHVINGEHYSGAERVQDLLAQRLPECGVEVEFACLKPELFPTDRVSQSTPVHELPMKSRLDLTVVARLATLAARQQVDLLHAHTPRAAMITALAAPLCGRSWVFHVHSPTVNDSTRSVLNQVNAWVERFAIRKAAAVVGVSQSMCQHMIASGVPKNRVDRVANGVPCREALPLERHSGQSHWTLGTVALFRPRKGTEILLESVHLLREAGHDVRLHAVGGFESPAYEHLLKSQVESLGLDKAVTWSGYTQDVASEMAKFDVFALPSHFGEGMPMVVLEAMALGIPVVATKVEGVPEVIQHGESGLLAEPGDPMDLAKQLQRLLDDDSLRAEIATCGHLRQQTSFSDYSMANGVAEVYESLIQLGRIR